MLLKGFMHAFRGGAAGLPAIGKRSSRKNLSKKKAPGSPCKPTRDPRGALFPERAKCILTMFRHEPRSVALKKITGGPGGDEVADEAFGLGRAAAGDEIVTGAGFESVIADDDVMEIVLREGIDCLACLRDVHRAPSL